MSQLPPNYDPPHYAFPDLDQDHYKHPETRTWCLAQRFQTPYGQGTKFDTFEGKRWFEVPEWKERVLEKDIAQKSLTQPPEINPYGRQFGEEHRQNVEKTFRRNVEEQTSHPLDAFRKFHVHPVRIIDTSWLQKKNTQDPDVMERAKAMASETDPVFEDAINNAYSYLTPEDIGDIETHTWIDVDIHGAEGTVFPWRIQISRANRPNEKWHPDPCATIRHRHTAKLLGIIDYSPYPEAWRWNVNYAQRLVCINPDLMSQFKPHPELPSATWMNNYHFIRPNDAYRHAPAAQEDFRRTYDELCHMYYFMNSHQVEMLMGLAASVGRAAFPRGSKQIPLTHRTPMSVRVDFRVAALEMAFNPERCWRWKGQSSTITKQQ
ncbi:hypothetical protein HDV00_005022 [Rhizophlyctis rosea]|nr:hypothetical protein HDV00_005022 [Rhizophlyctis rosea]